MGSCLPRLPAMLLLALTAGCSTAARDDSAAPGRVWDVHARRFVGADAARRAAREANIVLLGETHDNLEHHRLQRELLAQIVATGRRPALVMEQFDREFQAPLDAARSSRERDADAVLDAGRFNRRSWQIQGYRPLVELALDFDLPIVAANLSRDEARAIVARYLGDETVTLTDYTFGVHLRQNLLINLESQARWAIMNRLTEQPEVPDFLSLMYLQGLRSVDPEAVTVIQ